MKRARKPVAPKRLRRRCDGKVKHETLKAAQTAASVFVKKLQAKGDPTVMWLAAYACQCGGFHVGRTKNINWGAVK